MLHLSEKVLNSVAEKAYENMSAGTEGLFGTGQCDGWKKIKKNSLIASMVNVEYNDISSEQKTADNLLIIVKEEMKRIYDFFKVILVAWCTDASKYPWLVVLDCWAHQTNLIVSDILKLKVPLIQVADEALGLVKWFNNHSFALRLLVLILPVLTRWTSHYLALHQLTKLKTAFLCMVASDAICTSLIDSVGPDKTKAKKMIQLVKNNGFWVKVESLRDLLHPFAIAANLIQADNCHLNTVFTISTKPQQLLTTEFVMQLFWAFSTSNELAAPGRMWNIMRRVYRRLSCGLEPDNEFQESFVLYYSGCGCWSDNSVNLNYHHESASKQGTYVNLVFVWRELDLVGDTSEFGAGTVSMIRLAMQILSMVTNSAGTEHILSVFGSIHTDN
ncbi:hypothetical protein D9758_012821 [Tetrapyrgos nigripes]|uniref:DUF659 domain-containing protein n=1 Tax=Tetrapyrgos nigripes TaxID=182062 RepID=A0A8H5CYI7_9AGAR|nr:hypothetical protein D9758_012821 [Tetrapyrgos nigripes]